jgi:SAM-dependent methyltransferase
VGQKELRRYQSHGDISGMSASDEKLQRLSLPEDMSGLRVLDLGCNEGFFCAIAAERGAERVLGLDYVETNIAFARANYTHPNIEFRHQSWHKFPDEQFDLVIWTSAMHYDPNHRAAFANISNHLSGSGLLALECGVINSAVPEMRVIKRHSDTLFYPTFSLLEAQLTNYFDYRQLDRGQIAIGDPVPRYVFHCHKPRAQVMIFDGYASARDSFLKVGLSKLDAKILNLENFFRDLVEPPYVHTELQQLVAKTPWPSGYLRGLLKTLDQARLLDNALTLFLTAIAPSDRLVRLEIYGSDYNLVPKITELLKHRADVLPVARLRS